MDINKILLGDATVVNETVGTDVVVGASVGVAVVMADWVVVSSVSKNKTSNCSLIIAILCYVLENTKFDKDGKV